MATSAPIGFGEVGNEMSHSFRPKTEEQKRNAPFALLQAYLVKKIADAIEPPGTKQSSGVDLNNNAYFKANPINPVATNSLNNSPIRPPQAIDMGAPSLANANKEIKPIHVGPVHYDPRTPDPAHLQIDSDWGK